MIFGPNSLNVKKEDMILKGNSPYIRTDFRLKSTVGLIAVVTTMVIFNTNI